jgi:hypothetical protein
LLLGLIAAVIAIWLLNWGAQCIRFGLGKVVRVPASVASIAVDDKFGAAIISYWGKDYASLLWLASRRLERVPLSEKVMDYDSRFVPPPVAISPKGWGAVVTSEGLDALDLKKKRVVRHLLGPVRVTLFDRAGDVLHADLREIKMPEAEVLNDMSGAAEFVSYLAAYDEDAKTYSTAVELPSERTPWKLIFGKLHPTRMVREAALEGDFTMEEVGMMPEGRGALALVYTSGGRTELRVVPADPRLPGRTIRIPGSRPWDPTQGMPPPGALGHRRLYPCKRSDLVLVRNDGRCLLVDLKADKYMTLPFGASAVAISKKLGMAVLAKANTVRFWRIPERNPRGKLKLAF